MLGNIGTKSWASMPGFASMYQLAREPAYWELCTMAALSMSFGLRAVEAVSVSYEVGTLENGARFCKCCGPETGIRLPEQRGSSRGRPCTKVSGS